MRSKIKRFDETVLFSVQRNQTRKLSIAMLAFSLIGNGGLLWAFIGGLLLLDSSTSRYGAYLIVSLSLCALVNNIFFKSLCDRERPCDTYQKYPAVDQTSHWLVFPFWTHSYFLCQRHRFILSGSSDWRDCAVYCVSHCIFPALSICALPN